MKKQGHYFLYAWRHHLHWRLTHHPTDSSRGVVGFAAIVAGYQVIAEGIMATIQATRKRHRFSPNIHLLMALAALGAIAIGSFEGGRDANSDFCWRALFGGVR